MGQEPDAIRQDASPDPSRDERHRRGRRLQGRRALAGQGRAVSDKVENAVEGQRHRHPEPGAGPAPPSGLATPPPAEAGQAGGSAGGRPGQGEPARAGHRRRRHRFLAGLAIPSTRSRTRTLGPVADQVKDKMKTGQEALDRGKQVAREAASTATDSSQAERPGARPGAGRERHPERPRPRRGPAGAPGRSRRLGRWHGRGTAKHCPAMPSPSRGRWPHRSSTTGQTPYTRSVAHLEPKEPPVRPGRGADPPSGWRTAGLSGDDPVLGGRFSRGHRAAQPAAAITPRDLHVMAGWSASFGRNANPRRPAADNPIFSTAPLALSWRYPHDLPGSDVTHRWRSPPPLSITTASRSAPSRPSTWTRSPASRSGR